MAPDDNLTIRATRLAIIGELGFAEPWVIRLHDFQYP